METLTRNNYEIWFIDYLDGNLNAEELKILLEFMDNNPDLKVEFRGVSEVSLAAGQETTDQKESLMKSPADIPGMAALDQLCIARMENDLSEEESLRFDIRLNEDSRLEENYAALLLTRLNPENQVLYPYKKDLLRKTRVLTPWIITAISSAAVVMLAWILWPDSKETSAPLTAKTETVRTETGKPIPEIKQPAATFSLLAANSGKPKPAARHPKTVVPAKQEDNSPENQSRESIRMDLLTHRPAQAAPRIPDPERTRVLLASRNTGAIASPGISDKELTIPQLALQLFREKILGEDRSQVKKTRFTFWEVAGAGVNRINSIANTDMKLNRQYDDKGDLLAVSFNSRFFDVESPVRTQEK